MSNQICLLESLFPSSSSNFQLFVSGGPLIHWKAGQRMLLAGCMHLLILNPYNSVSFPANVHIE